ncbi:Zn-ribbon domain-containing OB-fold protein [Pusillimonas sp. ANT_WB101]|uniref:Zn-ribbon domain-containing OB-fold protein n=1 Tax=Pusillimonas sp. ANT_WB101 TaxID=2597356 RepID=UPI0011EDA6BA|nr:OB-fold domain-containing protein [Pusillimonas sp. ANT_WB101]KAA0890841.1 nucleic acid-binding protein [Pusillimonas sp. ANT_WB101]
MNQQPVMGPEAQFKSYLQQGKFMIQRSRATGKYVFYPRLVIPSTGETDLDWVEASGRGTVYSITVNRGKTETYNVALIDLEEGVRMMSLIVGQETVPIGTPVQASIVDINDAPAVVFTPLQGAE